MTAKELYTANCENVYCSNDCAHCDYVDITKSSDCDGCKYYFIAEYKKPCNMCKRNKFDFYDQPKFKEAIDGKE